MSERLVFASDLLGGTPDMGERVYARSLAHALAARGCAVVSLDGPAEGAQVSVRARRTLVSRTLFSALRHARPSVVVCLQRSSLTFFGVVRCRILSLVAGAPVVPLVLQPFPLSGARRRLLKAIAPRSIMVVSQSHAATLADWFPASVITVVSAAVDAEKFRPADARTRAELRAQRGVAEALPVVLHVGHLAASRNLRVLGSLASTGAVSVVLVASSSTPADSAHAAELSASGVRIVTGYCPGIEEWYRAADVYVFPTRDPGGSIAVPLSILEALACGLPVVTTPFGALPDLLDGVDGILFCDDDDSFPEAVMRALAMGVSSQSRYTSSWSDVADLVSRVAMGSVS